MALSSMFSGMSGMSGSSMFGAGASVLGGVTDYFASKKAADGIQASKKLTKWQLEKDQRSTIGKQTVAAAASGVKMEGSTLDAINQTRYQYEIDKAITMENFRLEKRGVQAAGKKALTDGVLGAVGIGMKDAEDQKFKKQVLSQKSQLLGTQKAPQQSYGMPWMMGFGK